MLPRSRPQSASSSPNALSSRGAQRRRICGCFWELKVAMLPTSRPQSANCPTRPCHPEERSDEGSAVAFGSSRWRCIRRADRNPQVALPTPCHPEERSDEGSAAAFGSSRWQCFRRADRNLQVALPGPVIQRSAATKDLRLLLGVQVSNVSDGPTSRPQTSQLNQIPFPGPVILTTLSTAKGGKEPAGPQASGCRSTSRHGVPRVSLLRPRIARTSSRPIQASHRREIALSTPSTPLSRRIPLISNTRFSAADCRLIPPNLYTCLKSEIAGQTVGP
jgi:hypothetical protein